MFRRTGISFSNRNSLPNRWEPVWDAPRKLLSEVFWPKPKVAIHSQPLQWLSDRLTVISNTDHNMGNGHGKEVSFLGGVLPSDANAHAEKNVSFDQVLARYLGGDVVIRMSTLVSKVASR